MHQKRDVIIIGSGVAGCSAAIYTARGGLNPLVFAGSVSGGGALATTTDVENFPGFPDGVQGPDLMDSMRRQAERFGAEFVDVDVTSVDLSSSPKTITADDSTYLADAVVIATGTRYRELGLDSEKRLTGRGVSWCATCDGFFFREMDVAVIGGGDSALEEALFLSRFARSVTVVHRRDQLSASKIMQQRARANQKIRFVWDSRIIRILGDSRVTGIRLQNIKSGQDSSLSVSGVFVAIGHEPRTELFSGQLRLDDGGYLRVDPSTTETEIPGVFAAGDVVDQRYRQAITAAGRGTAAALDVERWLQDQRSVAAGIGSNQ